MSSRSNCRAAARSAAGTSAASGALIVIEIRWRPSDARNPLPSRDARLRLVRAFPSGTEEAWRLVLDELPVRPDFIVADCSKAISSAVTRHYGAGAVGLIPTPTPLRRWRTRALRWWALRRPVVQASVPCGDRRALSCPDCRAGTGCSHDTRYQPITLVAVLGERGALDSTSIEDRLFGARPDRRIHAWRERHPAETAYMAWTAVRHETDVGRVAAAQKYLRQAVEYNLHLTEPRLALVHCQSLAANGKTKDAYETATSVMAHRTSDPGYDGSARG